MSRIKNSENEHTCPMEGRGADGGWYFIDHRDGAIYTDSVVNFSFLGEFVKVSAASKDEKKLTAECAEIAELFMGKDKKQIVLRIGTHLCLMFPED